MATNSILTFAETGTTADLLTDGEYNADAQRAIGHQPGVARAKLANKAAKQSSLLSVALAQFIADNQSNNISDALSAVTLASYLELAITAMAGENYLNKGYLCVHDQKANGTDGGGTTANADVVRELNTVVNNTLGASLASNKITLPAGTYRISASVPACNCNSHRAWLKNATAGTTLLVGSSEQSVDTPTTDRVSNRSLIVGQFTLASAADLEIHHSAQSTRASFGLGSPTSSSGDTNPEVYTMVEIFKV